VSLATIRRWIMLQELSCPHMLNILEILPWVLCSPLLITTLKMETDPDMVLIRSEGEYYPVEFQQDPVIYQCAVQWDGRGGITGFVSKSNYPQLNPEHG
jgi:hypothetical protein